MALIENFRFNNVALAAKNWYRKREEDSVCEFFVRIFNMDEEYIPTKYIERDAKKYALLVLDEISTIFRKHNRYAWWDSYMTYVCEIEKYENLYGATNVEAHIHFVFNVLMQLDGSVINLKKPIYNRNTPRLSYKQGMTYKEMQRRADRIFDKN